MLNKSVLFLLLIMAVWGLGTLSTLFAATHSEAAVASLQQNILEGSGNGGVYLPLSVKPFRATTARVSIASDGTQGNHASGFPSISADGRYVAFYSIASNLVSNDTNGMADIFVHDRHTGMTSRISLASDGTEANGSSIHVDISADGRYVAFDSYASNLVPGDTNGYIDVFVHDRQTGETSRISVGDDGTQGNHESDYPVISADGRYVAFQSAASNLIANDTNSVQDIFAYDRQTEQTSRVSVASDGTQGDGRSLVPSISADGRFVAFQSEAANLGTHNGFTDIFVHDRQTGETVLVSLNADGVEGNYGSWAPSISASGRFVAFFSDANNLVSHDTNHDKDVFVRDLETGETRLVSVSSDGVQGNTASWSPVISADGRFVVFYTDANTLVNDDTNNSGDVFVHDQQTAETSRVSIASDGTQSNHHSGWPSISANGRYVVFDSDASNLVSDDTNGVLDVFVHDWDPQANTGWER